jgi:Ni,Fe-hydrogenase III large subunit
MLADLPVGDVCQELLLPDQASRGAGWVEGWRGEIFVALELEGAPSQHRIRRCHFHDPSWQNWPVLEHAIMGNIVPDFPLINKSFNLSYSGQDL